MDENKGFDLAAYLGSLDLGPESGPQREQIVYLDLSLLDEDEENFYATEGIEDLAANIATIGLLDPLRVRPDPDAPGRFKVVSGHRRRKALTLLKEDDPEKWGTVPCIQEDNAASPAAQELRLILANKDNRKMSGTDLLEQAKRVEKLLYQLQEEQGVEFPGRMRDHVAKAVGASKSKLSRLNVIDENLCDCWRDAYRSGELKESPAYDLARMKPEYQSLIFEAYKSEPKSVGTLGLDQLEDDLDRIAAFHCGATGQVCENTERMMKKSVRCDSVWKRCRRCCVSCPDLRSCRYSCPKAKEEKLLLKKAEAEAKERKADAAAEEKAKNLAEQSVLYTRLGAAMTAAGISVRDYCSKVLTGLAPSSLEAFIAGEYGDGRLYPPYSSLYDVKPLVAAADVLGCSIDWLLGRDVPGPDSGPTSESIQIGPNSGAIQEETPAPRSGWMTGEPEEDGKYAVLTSDRMVGRLFGDICGWKDGKWWGLMEDEVVRYWTPMPEE